MLPPVGLRPESCGVTREPPGHSTDERHEKRPPRKGTSGVSLVVPPHFATFLNIRRVASRWVRRSAGRASLPCNGSSPVAAYCEDSPRFGARLGGLTRQRARSRFAATAVLWPVCAGSMSSSSPVTYSIDRCIGYGATPTDVNIVVNGLTARMGRRRAPHSADVLGRPEEDDREASQTVR